MKKFVLLLCLMFLASAAPAAAGGLTGGLTSGGGLVSGGSLTGGICSPCPAPSGTNQPAISGGGITSLPAPIYRKSLDPIRRCLHKPRPKICRHGISGGPPPDRWLAIAASYWGVTATCPPSTVSLIWDQDLLDNTPVGRVFGMANIGACWNGGIFNGAGRTIWLNPYYRGVGQVFSDHFWCKVVTHEYGHLIGLYHYQSDQYPIMGQNLPYVPVPGC